MMKLKTMVGDHPITLPLKRGEVAPQGVALDIADVARASSAFKRVVRGMEFDVAELAIVTFLIAKAHGKPLALLPAVVAARFQHPFLAYNAARGPLTPAGLAGKKIGIRSYSVTTGAWMRSILWHDHGVQPDAVQWITLDEPHVAEFQDPPNVTRVGGGKDMVSMLRDGEIAAAILGEGLPKEDWCQPLIADPAAAASDWQQRHGAIQINHMLVVRQSLLDQHPEAVKDVYQAFAQSRGIALAAGAAPLPFGFEANRRNLEVAIACAYEQRLIPQRYSVDELFTDVTRALA
ncbi:phosphate ABC transporter substrate-binding protein [Ramlibacter sp. G-1-2-2]|uniref:Phosphate ABC transporter substrate-binding protein n=1 Tax=Ramlibacter agri TaxID=2728837 RepID=A0A848H382_9BURK|nr:phosphate ABC transporter substrate-binding protein [Ramlibacter agri]NML42248.1 phosphate ABC transporter substrate-binding protein [Ramlibacter agri]